MNINNTFLKSFIYIFLTVIFLLTSTADSQIKYTTKKFKQSAVTVELLFNYSQPLPNMYGEIGEFFSFSNYGVKTGFGSQINVKLAANKKGTIRPFLTIGYNMFIGTNDVAYIDSNNISHGYPLVNNNRYGTEPGTSKMYIHVFTAGLGFGYDFVNKTKWTPFLGLETDLNVIFGTYRQTPNEVRGPNPTTSVSYTIKQAVRFGLGLGAGVQFRVSKIVGFSFVTKYKLANVLGASSNRITELNKMELLDKADTDIHDLLTKSRKINYFEFNLGVGIYIGKR